MVRRYSWNWRLHCVLCSRFLCGLAVQDGDTRAWLQLVLSVDHHLLVGLETGINERLPIAHLRDLDGSDGHGAVGIDDISVGSFRTLLHDRCGNGQAVMPCIDEQPR